MNASTTAMVSGTEVTTLFRPLTGIRNERIHQATLDLMESEYVYPRSADRSLPDDWQDLGATDVWQ